MTRAERKTLLGLSAVGIVIARSGLVPSRISALGIEFDRTDQSALLGMLAAVVIYFLVAFVVYATSDLVAWRIAFRNAMLSSRREYESQTAEQRTAEDRLRATMPPSGQWLVGASRSVSFIRTVFEFGIPLFIGVFAVYALLSTPPPRAGGPEGLTKPSSGPMVQPAPARPETVAQPLKRLQPPAPRQ